MTVWFIYVNSLLHSLGKQLFLKGEISPKVVKFSFVLYIEVCLSSEAQLGC